MKSAAQRLRESGEPVIKIAPLTIAGAQAGQVMLVPTAAQIDAFMREVPRGKAVSVKEMRAELARRFDAEITCAIYTGYHLRTVAEAALEALAAGVPEEAITPFWRVIDGRTPTTPRLPDGPAFVTRMRRAEGLPP